MWPSNLAKPLRRPPIKRSADDSEDWAEKSFEDMRSRQPVFRMPQWMSEDDDVSHLASRMSQAPHFATMGGRGARGGPYRERRNSGGSAMSGTSEDDSVDSSSHRQEPPAPLGMTIPIRIEAEAPPGSIPMPPPPTQEAAVQPGAESTQPIGFVIPQQQPAEAAPTCVGQLRKQPSYASRTTSAVDALSQQQVPRDTRCASAPPDMTDPTKFISKTKVTPQNSNEKSHFGISPVFNNVPKPFVSSSPAHNTPPIQEEQTTEVPPAATHAGDHQQQQPQHVPEDNFYNQQQYPPGPEQWSGHKSSIVRNIPIFVEGRDNGFAKEPTPPPLQQQPQQQPQQQQRQSQWEHPSQGHQQQQHQQQGNWDHPNQPQWDPFQKPQWDHAFDSPSASFGFQPDPFFEFPQRATNFQSPSQGFPQQDQRQQRQQTPPKQAPRQPSPPKQAPRQPSPPKQVPRQPSPPKQIPKEEHQVPPVQPPKDVKLEKISQVRASIEEFFLRAKTFQGNKKNKDYLYLDEMLTRALISLDNIEPEGRDDVRQARRSLIKDINDTLTNLERVASASTEEEPTTLQSSPKEQQNDSEEVPCSNPSEIPAAPVEPAEQEKAPSPDQTKQNEN